MEAISSGGYALLNSTHVSPSNVTTTEKWIYDANLSSYLDLKLTDSIHRNHNNFSSSQVAGLTDHNYAYGSAARYYGTSASSGYTAWTVHLPTNTYRAYELDDSVHLSSTGQHQTTILGVRDFGMVYGIAVRYEGETLASRGQSMWVGHVDSDEIYVVGLYDDAFRNADGRVINSISTALPQSDRYLAGGAIRYNGGSSGFGTTPWIADSQTGITIRSGLTGFEHTSSTGYQHSYHTDINNSGYAVGFAHRYNGKTVEHGRSAWVTDFHANETHFLGFRDAAHTGYDDYKYSLVMELNESGYARGYSLRYDGQVESTGRSTWIQNVVTKEITRVGLLDGVHTSPNGYDFSNAERFTESGFVAGFSQRFDSSNNEIGQTAWVYQISDQSYTRFDLSINESTGFSYSTIRALSESGVAYGHYADVETGVHLGDRAFVWSEETGTVKLTEEMESAVNSYGWDNLRTYSKHNDIGYIAGLGDFLVLNPDSLGVFVVLMIPEPSRGLILLLGCSALLMRRSRR